MSSNGNFSLDDELGDECRALNLEDEEGSVPEPSMSRGQQWMRYLEIDTDMDTSPLHSFNEVFDLPEQDILRRDCAEAVEKLGNEDDDKVSILCDLESILTCFCKNQHITYSSSHGWIEILLPLLSLKLTKHELYAVFSALVLRYVPRECDEKGKPFHLFRLLLLYHEPELCSYLDSRKIFPDSYALAWFRTLFASSAALEVIQNVWDYYLRQEDPFFLFFLALVVLMNQKDTICESQDTAEDLSAFIASIPFGLSADDVEDLCSLAQYYAVKTPHSFWNEFRYIFNRDICFPVESALPVEINLSQALCMPVTVQELLTSTLLARHVSNVGCSSERPRFFVVDCRPADQYNAGHLPTAFHLDADLMLQEKNAFALASQGLLTAQKQALEANSVAGGEHLCFVGSGREKEDQYVRMVVANFLQKYCAFVSMLVGGYEELHGSLVENLEDGLTDHNPKKCLVCAASFKPVLKKPKTPFSFVSGSEEVLGAANVTALFDKIGTAVKSKSSEMKKHLVEYLTNTGTVATDDEVKHVSPRDKIGRMYRGMASVFTIDDEPDDEVSGYPAESEDYNAPEIISIKTWLKKSDVVGHFSCHEVKLNDQMFEAILLVTETHLYILRKLKGNEDEAAISVRRALNSFLKITSKKKMPELITFRYGVRDGENFIITDMDRILIPKSFEATRLIKSKVLECTEGLDAAGNPKTPDGKDAQTA